MAEIPTLTFMHQGHGIPDWVVDAMRERYEAELNLRLAVAMQSGFRLAAEPFRPDLFGFVGRLPTPTDIAQVSWEFVMLSPGERAPRGWTLYENRGGIAVGRTA